MIDTLVHFSFYSSGTASYVRELRRVSSFGCYNIENDQKGKSQNLTTNWRSFFQTRIKYMKLRNSKAKISKIQIIICLLCYYLTFYFIFLTYTMLNVRNLKSIRASFPCFEWRDFSKNIVDRPINCLYSYICTKCHA